VDKNVVPISPLIHNKEPVPHIGAEDLNFKDVYELGSFYVS